MPSYFSPEALRSAYKGIELKEDNTQQSENKRGISPYFKLFDIAGQGLDAGTTTYGLTHGYHESNPIMPKGLGPNLATKVATTGATLYAIQKLQDEHPNVAKLLAITGGLSGFIPGLLNINTYKSK